MSLYRSDQRSGQGLDSGMHRTHLPHRCSAAVWTCRQGPSFGWAAQQAIHSVLCSSVYRCAPVCCHVPASICRHTDLFPCSGPQLNLQVAECSIVFPFTHDTAQQLSQAMTQLLQTFSEKQKAERPKRWPMMEFRCQGEPGFSECLLY